MKKKIIKINLKMFILVIIIAAAAAFAQSDYEIVQNFRKDYAGIKDKIENADSLAQLNSIVDNIAQLRDKYSEHADLLDNGLYPDQFETSIAKLNSAYILRQGDFARIDVLKTEVSTLKKNVDTLNTKNNELLANLERLESLSNKNSKQIGQLNNLVAELRGSLLKRDRLVMSMVDSLMPPIMREKTMLSPEDKEQINSEIEKDNVLTNVKTTIKDNIQYLNLTTLQPEDLKDIQSQQNEFEDTWSRIGGKLVDVYADNNSRSRELREIDSLFTRWKYAVRKEAWNSISEVFAKKGVPLKSFSNEESFVNSVSEYIEDEKKNIETQNENKAEQNYALFVDSTWYGEIKPVWTNYLIEYGMLSEENKDSIESNIAGWKSELYPSTLWIWIIIAGLLAASAVILLTRKRRTAEGTEPPV